MTTKERASVAELPQATLLASPLMRRPHGSPTRVLIEECVSPGAVNLRLAPGDTEALTRALDSLGADLPMSPSWVTAGEVTMAWQAYDEWLLLTADGNQDRLIERLRAALAGCHAALTDVSDLHASFEVGGPSSRDLLAKGCALDLHPGVFQAGHCAATALARVRVTLRQLDDAPRFQLLVERSYAQYLWDWLTDAAVEFLGAE
jgi:sarcosine oxidase subunit gamma